MRVHTGDVPTQPLRQGTGGDARTTLTVPFEVLLDMWVMALGFVEE